MKEARKKDCAAKSARDHTKENFTHKPMGIAAKCYYARAWLKKHDSIFNQSDYKILEMRYIMWNIYKKKRKLFCHAPIFPLQVVYGNMLTDPWDHLYLFTVVSHILTATARSGSQLMLGAIAMPTPPANVEPSDYAGWLGEKWDEGACTTEALSMDDGVKKLVNKAR